MNTQKGKISVLLALLAVSFINGACSYFIEDGSTAFWVGFAICTVITEVLLMRWFIFDAREREYPLPKFAYVLFFLVTPLMIPIYFVETRGKGAWRPILFTLLFAGLMVAASIVGLKSSETGIAMRQKTETVPSMEPAQKTVSSPTSHR